MKTTTLILSIFFCINLGLAVEQRNIEKRFPVLPSQLIDMRGFKGTGIKFSSWDKNEVFIKLHIEVKSSEEQFEKNYFNEAMLEELRTDSSLIITYKGTGKIINIDGSFWSRLKSIFSMPHTNTYSISILGEIIIPQSNSITINTSSSSITLENMKGDIRFLGSSNNLVLKRCGSVQDINNNYGTTTLDQCGGNLVLSAINSTITINEFDGGGIINADYSKITVQNIKKDFTIKSRGSENVNVKDAQANLSIEAIYSTIDVKRVAGTLDLKGHRDTMTLAEAQAKEAEENAKRTNITLRTNYTTNRLDIKGLSGDKVILEDIAGDLNIESQYSSIDLKNIKGKVTLSTRSSDIKANEIRSDWKSESEYSSFSISNFYGRSFVLTNKSNPIEVELKSLPKHLKIKNEYGPATVTMPYGYTGEVALESSNGKIECNLPVKVKSLENSCYATGKIGNGNGSISIETTSGNVKLFQE